MDSSTVVLGAGAWGTALAIVLARSGGEVYLWGHDATHVATLASTHTNARYLPGIALPENVKPLVDLRALPSRVDLAVLVVPFQTLRENATALSVAAPWIKRYACASKGVERQRLCLAHEIMRACVPGAEVGILSGPNFALEVAQGRPAAITVATDGHSLGEALCARTRSGSFRPYLSDDLVGVAVGGAVKNVLAIAAGVADGLNLGANSRAALITRGLAEITRLGVRLGGRTETFMGLSGLGDLVLTATDDQSRNRRFGLALGRGQTHTEARAECGLVEGMTTARAVAALAERCGVSLPICMEVLAILDSKRSPTDAVMALMNRDLTAEIEAG